MPVSQVCILVTHTDFLQYLLFPPYGGGNGGEGFWKLAMNHVRGSGYKAKNEVPIPAIVEFKKFTQGSNVLHEEEMEFEVENEDGSISKASKFVKKLKSDISLSAAFNCLASEIDSLISRHYIGEIKILAEKVYNYNNSLEGI